LVAKSQPLAAQQQEIWQSDAQKVLYAQLCNAFYQREVQRLVAEPNADKLRRQLKSLPYYIERTATLVANGSSPFSSTHKMALGLKNKSQHRQRLTLRQMNFFIKNMPKWG